MEQARQTIMRSFTLLALMLAMMAAVTSAGYALDDVAYQEASFDEKNGEVIYTGKKASSCIEVGGGTTTWTDGGWYVVSKDVSIKDRIKVSGTVNLILCDDCTLTARSGIEVAKGKTLNIYAQSKGTGAIKATGSMNAAAIGSTEPDYNPHPVEAGNIVINGGNINATGGQSAAGIGGGYSGGSTVIYGGTISAQGGGYYGGAGIGGGYRGSGGSITIYGGTIDARGHDGIESGAAGIGGGSSGHCGTVKIYGGKIYAAGGTYAAGIGAGSDGANGTITISGGDITAAGGDSAAGIGEGIGYDYYINDKEGVDVTISGGTVTARGGANGAGIGSGKNGNGRQTKGTVTISGGTVTANGSGCGAGIGGGNYANGGRVSISGGDVYAYGGKFAAGIGGGGGGSGGDVTITGGKVTANGQEYAKGIGGGFDGGDGSLKLGTGVTLYGGDSEDPTAEIRPDISGNYARYQYMTAKETPYTITTENIGNVQVTTDMNMAFTGETVNVTVEVGDSYSPKAYLKKTSDGSLIKVLILKRSDNSYTGSFMMPAHDVTVTGTAGTSGDVSKEISGLWTGSISDPATGSWNKVYFGSQNDPIKFNVLKVNETHFGGNTLLLDCEGIIEDRSFGDNNKWADSSLKTWLNGEFLNSRFTSSERTAIAKSSKTERAEGYDGGELWDGQGQRIPFTSLDGEQVFLLDTVEATNTNYGFESTTDYTNTRVKDDGYYDGAPWWLRSPYNDIDKSQDWYIDEIGEFDYIGSGSSMVGVSPALNIDMNSVLFSSKTSDGAYKLTVKDSDMAISPVKGVREAGSMSFTYSLSGANEEKINRVSVVIIDSYGSWDQEKGTWSSGTRLKYYGPVVGELGSYGSASLPANYENTWKVYLVPEQVNEGNATDYAGEPVQVTDLFMKITPDESIQHGKIHIDKDEAKIGDTITVTVIPEGSYSTDRAFARDATGGSRTQIAKLTGKDGVFTGTFTMPSYPVIVTATLGSSGDSKQTENTLSVKGRTATVKYSSLKKQTRTLKRSQVIRLVKRGQGTLSYKYVTAKKGSKSFSKYFKINKKTGKLIIKKGLKKGTYKVTVKLKAAGKGKYKASSWKKAVIRIKVK